MTTSVWRLVSQYLESPTNIMARVAKAGGGEWWSSDVCLESQSLFSFSLQPQEDCLTWLINQGFCRYFPFRSRPISWSILFLKHVFATLYVYFCLDATFSCASCLLCHLFPARFWLTWILSFLSSHFSPLVSLSFLRLSSRFESVTRLDLRSWFNVGNNVYS